MIYRIKSAENKFWDRQCLKSSKTYFKLLFVGLSVVSLITFIVYLAYGVNKKVGQNEYAVVRNKYTTKLYGPMEQGVYNNLTIGDTIYRYTSTMQFLDFDGSTNNYINCFTEDGLKISLEIIIQYQYRRDEIIPVIWYLFNDEATYTDFITKTMRGLIYQDCAYFNASNYYSKRNIIEDKLFETIVSLFNNNTLGINIFNVQLKNIIFPYKFVDVIASKQHLVQEIQTQYNNRTSQLINANTTRIQAIQQAEIIIIDANNEANLIVKGANATADNIGYKFEKLAEIYLNVKKELNLQSTELIDYIYSAYAKNGAVFASI